MFDGKSKRRFMLQNFYAKKTCIKRTGLDFNKFLEISVHVSVGNEDITAL